MTIFTITSATALSGKTLLSRLIMMQKGRLRKKILYLSFDLTKREKGAKDLIAVLKEEVTLVEAMIRDPMYNADIVIGNNGESMPVPLTSARLDLLREDIKMLAKEYDVVLLDMPEEYLFFSEKWTDVFYVITTPEVETLTETHRLLRKLPAEKTQLIVNRVKDGNEGKRLYEILKSTQKKKVNLKGVIREGRTAAYEDVEAADL